MRRVAIEASVALRAGPAPAGAWPGERDVSGRRIRYRIDRADGGSGGTQFDFQAWEACASGHVEYAQGDVVEDPGEPDFSLVWTVIAGTQPPSQSAPSAPLRPTSLTGPLTKRATTFPEADTSK
jgi:hypothetical protein